MKRFISYGSIEQFRSVVREVTHSAQFTGLDDSGNPTYNNSIKLPTRTAFASEKIHGTNAAVCYSIPDGYWFQSRNNIIAPGNDNAGCALAADENIHQWMTIITTLAKVHDIDLTENIISVFYEWAGGGIQKNSAVTGLDKMAFIFRHFKVSPIDPESDRQSEWLSTMHLSSPDHGIYNIGMFPTFTLDIDFNFPAEAQNKMVDLTQKIEDESGVAQYFSKDENIGEGLVWTIVDTKGKLLRWKTKGEKHSKSKVKTLSVVDAEAERVKVEFVNSVCTPSRLEQAWQTVFGIENEKCEPDIKMTGDFLRAVITDIMKEEADRMEDLGLTPKEVNPLASRVSRGWFMEQLNNMH